MRLLVNAVDVSECVVAESRAARRNGLLGIDHFEHAMWFPEIRSVHTFRMRFSIDVAFFDDEKKVIRTQTMRPNQLSPWVRTATGVIEAQAGAFARWQLSSGSTLGLL